MLLLSLQPLRLIARSCGVAADENDAAGHRPITELTTPRAAHGLAAPTTTTLSVTVI